MKKTELIYLLVFSIILFVSCNNDDTSEEIILSNQNQIESFIVEYNSVEYTADINQESGIINLLLPSGADLTKISPVIDISDKASVSPSSNSEQDFSLPVTYLVTAENGNINEYLVTILAPSNQNDILSLSLNISDSESVYGFIDEESKSILLEIPNSANISSLKINLTISENAISTPSSGDIIDLSSPMTYQVTAENGDIAEYRVATYTVNQLQNPSGDDSGDGWNFEGNTGIEQSSEFGNIFFVIANDGDFSPNINQSITFPRDYSNKYVLFIGNLTSEYIVENSITRHPYLWAYQIGNFSSDDWIYMQDMSHTESENVWQIVHGTHKLLPNVEGTYFKIAQALQNGDPYDGTKSKYRGLEVRLFESSEDAEIYVNNLYKE